MKIQETAKNGLKYEYSVVISANDVEVKTAEQLQKIGKTAKIAGFRAGRIPVSMLKQRYGKSVMGEVLEKSVQDATQKVINDNHLRPALKPEIKIVSFDEGKDLEFTMAVEVFPDVPEVDISAVEITKPTFEVEEKEVDEAVSRLADRHKIRTPKDDAAAAEKGDVVRINFKGLKDGVAFEGGTAENFHLELGSGQFIPGFEEQLIGAKKGNDLKVDVSFPENYHAEDLAGQPVVFEVTVHEVMQAQAPNLDDAFAKNVGFETLEALKVALKEHISKDYEGYARNHMKKDLFDRLEDLCTFDVPQGMVDIEFKNIWEKLKQAQAEGDESVFGKTDEQLKTEYHAIAVRRVRLGVYLAELGRKNNVQISQQELMQAIIGQARMYPGQEKKVVDFYRSNPDHLEELRGPIFEDKVVDFLFGKVKTNEKKVSLEELMAMEYDDVTKKPTKDEE